MQRSMARRYAPLAALAAVQLLVIALVPVVSGGEASRVVESGPVATVPGGVEAAAGAATAGDAGALEVGTAAGVTDPIATSATGAGRPGPSVAPSQTGAADVGTDTSTGSPGDTSHCRDGRQFGALYYAPPCVPRWGGGDNGGATYAGVTAETITVVRYNSQSDPAVDALLTSQDLASSDEQEEAFQAAAERFVNANYELWGRELDLVTFDGGCDLLPPDYACLRNDMRKLLAEHEPFAVFWNTPLASPAFDELSAQKVVNAGGWHFDDAFHTQRRPFHIDPSMSGTRVASHVAEYWCKRLAGKPARYAGDPTMQVETRRLGLISPSDDANRRVAAEFKQMVKGCGGGVVADYYYDQDIDRANEQRKAGVAKMRAADVTTVVCICGGIAPYFLVLTCDEDRYYPEHLLPGTGGGVSLGMDSDAIGRLYSKSTQMDQFFGISTLPNPEPWNANDAARVWRAAGETTDPPYRTAIGEWRYIEMFAGAIQMAGPNLNPLTFEEGLFRTGRASDGPGHETFAYGAGDYTGVEDVREVYWSSTAISEFDGKPGSWVPMNGGRRYLVGQWPADEPELPVARG